MDLNEALGMVADEYFDAQDARPNVVFTTQVPINGRDGSQGVMTPKPVVGTAVTGNANISLRIY
jgi:hypothetical protein